VTAIYVAVVPAAAVTATHVTVVPVLVVIFQSGGVALVPDHIAVEKSHAAESVAIFQLLHAQIALAAYGDAHVLNVRRYALVAVVQKSVVTLAIYVTSIFMQIPSEALFSNMSFYFKCCIKFGNIERYKIVSSYSLQMDVK
jgi:hypothetical protein